MAGEFQRFISDAQPTTQGSSISVVGEALSAFPIVAEAGLSIRDAVQLSDVQGELEELGSLDQTRDDDEVLTAKTELGRLAEARAQGIGSSLSFQTQAKTLLANAGVRNPRIIGRLNQLGTAFSVGGRGTSGAVSANPLVKAQNEAIQAVETIRIQRGLSYDDAVTVFQDRAMMAEQSKVIDFNLKALQLSNLDLATKQRSYTATSGNISEVLVNNSFANVVGGIPALEGTAPFSGSPVDFLSFAKGLYAQAGSNETAITAATLEIESRVAAAKAVYFDLLSDEQAIRGGQMTPSTRDKMQAQGENIFAALDTQLKSQGPQAFLEGFNRLSIAASQADAIRWLQSTGNPMVKGMIPTLSQQGTLPVLQGIQTIIDIQKQIVNEPALSALLAGTQGKDGALMRSFLANPTQAMSVPSILELYNTGDFGESGFLPEQLITQDTYGPIYNGVIKDKRTDDEVQAEIDAVPDKQDNPSVTTPDQRTKFMNTIKAATSRSRTLPLLLSPETARRLSSDKEAQDWYDQSFRQKIFGWVTGVQSTFREWPDKSLNITIPKDGRFISVTSEGAKISRAIRKPVSMFEATYRKDVTTPTLTPGLSRTNSITDTDGNVLFDTMVAAMSNYRSPKEIEEWLASNFGEAADLLKLNFTINGRPIRIVEDAVVQ